MTALLPCPWCQKEPHRCMSTDDVTVVECRTDDCPLSFTPFYDQDWNRRAPITVGDAMVERAIEAQRNACRIFPGHDSIDYNAAMRAALEAAIGGKS